ncbi:MAG TPA: protein-L-isoaspartate(D-aspartate) O-methyltransferase [Pirellulales bacterium]|nr:protein-L-isoaspartate(D-aspartate) O-methyltransferase [Pirellulales bacterium]
MLLAGAAPIRSGDWEKKRNQMVDECVVAAGVKDKRVIQSIRDTPRHEFIYDREQRKDAYKDQALPIGDGATISPPYVVASMTEQLDPQPSDVVLEIGTGSGYQAAVLSPLVKEVYTIEIKPLLGSRAKKVLEKLGYKNVFTMVGDGYKGWPEHAPFDKIIVTCSPEKIPQPLVDQLRNGGRMIIPEGERFQQLLYLYRKVGGKMEREAVEATMFIPMTGNAEDIREVQYDAEHPELVNGGFETSTAIEGKPDGWYYVRQATLEKNTQAPEGEQYLTLRNATPARFAQALQSFGVNGAKIGELQISVWVRTRNVSPGPEAWQRPRLRIVFFDKNRAMVKEQDLGPWTTSRDWTEEKGTFPVPRNAQVANLYIGLLGATGEISFDDVKLHAVARTPK